MSKEYTSYILWSSSSLQDTRHTWNLPCRYCYITVSLQATINAFSRILSAILPQEFLVWLTFELHDSVAAACKPSPRSHGRGASNYQENSRWKRLSGKFPRITATWNGRRCKPGVSSWFTIVSGHAWSLSAKKYCADASVSALHFWPCHGNSIFWPFIFGRSNCSTSFRPSAVTGGSGRTKPGLTSH